MWLLLNKNKFVNVIEGDPKAPFSIATTSRCREGRYAFPGLTNFILDLYFIMLSVKQGGIKYHFLSLWYDSTWDWTQVCRTISEHETIPVKVKLATVVDGDQKAPFSIATTLRCRGGVTPFLGLLHFTLDTYLIMPSVKQGSIKYYFKSLWYDANWDWTQVSRTISEHSTRSYDCLQRITIISYLKLYNYLQLIGVR